MSGTLKVDDFDLWPYLRLHDGDGFDPMDGDKLAPEFMQSGLSEGQDLLAVNEENGEFVIPVHLTVSENDRQNFAANSGLRVNQSGWRMSSAELPGGQSAIRYADSDAATGYLAQAVDSYGSMAGNPDMEDASGVASIQYWTAGAGSSIALETISSRIRVGPGSMRLTRTAVGSGDASVNSQSLGPLPSSVTYPTWTVYARVLGDNIVPDDVALWLDYYDTAVTTLTQSVQVATGQVTSDGYVTLSGTSPIPATDATHGGVRMRLVVSNIAQNAYVTIDEMDYRVSPTAPHGLTYGETPGTIPVSSSEGDDMYMRFRLKVDPTFDQSVPVEMFLKFYDSGGATVQTRSEGVIATLNPPSAYITDFEYTAPIPANAASMSVGWWADWVGDIPVAWFGIADIVIDTAPITGPWFDGDVLPADWDGTPRASTSSMPGGRQGLNHLVRKLHNVLKRADQVEWRDEGVDESTFYDVVFGRFEPEYKYRRANARYLTGIVRVWIKPYGHTGTYRSLVAGATGQAFVYKQIDGLDGDAYSQVQVTLTSDLSGPHTVGFGVLPHPSWTLWMPVGSIVASAAVGTMVNDTQALGGQYHSLTSNISTQVYRFRPPVPTAHTGETRLLLYARMSASLAGVAMRAVDTLTGDSIGATAVATAVASGWSLYDLGKFRTSDTQFSPTREIGIYAAGFSGGFLASRALNVMGVVALPEDSSVLVTIPSSAGVETNAQASQSHRFDPDSQAWRFRWAGSSMVTVSDVARQRGRLPVIDPATSAFVFGFELSNRNPAPAPSVGFPNRRVVMDVNVRERFTFAR